MFLHLLDKPRELLLKKILADPPVPNAYLAGGTAVALQLGHRESVDFDWFSATLFDAEAVAESLAEIGRVRML